MKNKRGFTLLELLVVILIIGILTAVALPQYRRSVMKSRLNMGISLIESIYETSHEYFMRNNDFPIDIDDLDIEIPNDNSCDKYKYGNGSYIICDWGTLTLHGWVSLAFSYPSYPSDDPDAASDIGYLRIFQNYPKENPIFKEGDKYCLANSTNADANAVCHNMGGTTSTTYSNMNYYKL